jgi:hypothetical protein
VLSELTHATFAKELGSAFQLHNGAATPLTLELVEATEVNGKAPRTERNPFSLIFRGPKTPWVEQKIYRLEHERLGTLDIFLVPLGPDQKGMRYEAIFT